jgi:hypothetical protein
MQWYVSHQGETIGPHEGQVLHAKIQQMVGGGQSLAGAYVREEAGSWMPIEQSPFASALQAPVLPAKPARPPGPSLQRQQSNPRRHHSRASQPSPRSSPSRPAQLVLWPCCAR